MTLGHLVVLPVGHMVFGIDPVNQKLLWERNLHSPIAALGGHPETPGNTNFSQPLAVDPLDGSVVAVYPDWKQRLGQTGSLEGSAICLQAREGLVAVDPLTGRVLWVRTDIGTRSKIFGDGDNVYIVEMTDKEGDSNHSMPSRTRAVRISDGVEVKTVPSFTELYAKPTTRSSAIRCWFRRLCRPAGSTSDTTTSAPARTFGPRLSRPVAPWPSRKILTSCRSLTRATGSSESSTCGPARKSLSEPSTRATSPARTW